MFERNKPKGHSEKGEEEKKPEEIDVFQISDHLRSRLERVREEIRKEVEPTSILPKLDQKREHLEKDIHQDQKKIEEIENLIPKLEEKKKELLDGIDRKQKEISRIDEIKLILQI